MQIRILSMTAQRGGEEILITVELCEDVFDTEADDPYRLPKRENRQLSILTDRYTEIRPMKGVIDEELFGVLEDAAAFTEAVRMGSRMLAFGAQTKHALEMRLHQKGAKREVAREAVAYLTERGYIVEEADAVREAERNVRKLRGRNRIRSILYEKGYDGDAIAAADAYMDGVDFVDVCRVLIRKRYAALAADPAQHKRMAATLMRNGFTMREIRAAMER